MKKVIGIDLGTTNTVFAYTNIETEILKNDKGGKLTRSCVGLRDDKMVVGSDAFNTILRLGPKDLILSIKRFMGRAIDDEPIQTIIDDQKEKDDFSYYQYIFKQKEGGTENSCVVIMQGKEYTPEEITAEILKKVKKDVEKELGEEITHAVITVPAYFETKHKFATRKAAEMAGFKILRLLAEPTAAAISYGIDNLKAGEAKTVMIFDFGGGTFDLSILNIVDGQFMEMATGGDLFLGGDDIDQLLQEYIYQVIEKEYNIIDIKETISRTSNKLKNRFLFEIRQKTESAKIQLSTSEIANITILSLLQDQKGNDIDIDIQITRSEFEKLIQPLIERSIELIDSLLNEIHYDIDIIDDILLVGGSACIPLVKKTLIAKYGSDKIKMIDEPMFCVAKGAAMLAHKLSYDYECPNCGHIIKENDEICSECNYDLTKKKDISPIKEILYSAERDYFMDVINSEGEITDPFPIIKKQTPLPLTNIEVFKTVIDNQPFLELRFYSKDEKGEYNHHNYEFCLLDDSLPAGTEIIFEFNLGVDKDKFTTYVYPKNNKNLRKKIKYVIPGSKKEKAYVEIGSLIKKVKEYSTNVQLKALQAIKNWLKEGATLENDDDAIWFKIYFIASEYKIEDDNSDESDNTIFQTRIICYFYKDIIGKDYNTMMELIETAEDKTDILQSIKAKRDLVKYNDKYDDLFMYAHIKIASDLAKDKGESPDSVKLDQMHGQIINCYTDNNHTKGVNIFENAWDTAKKYLKIKKIDPRPEK